MELENIPVPDAELRYAEQFYNPDEADRLFRALQKELPWEQHRVKLFGKEHPAPRLSAWHGDPGVSYAYSGQRYQPHDWTPALREIRADLESCLQQRFNSLLANRYRNGEDSMGWHSDNEADLGENPLIASLSFGVPRRFVLRHRRHPGQEDVDFMLGHGSLLIMAGECQKAWKHQLPKSKKVSGERINLTFRQIRMME
ncbi:MAG TPA: alpha-ketoglutarate-dependent dioxygenase AlkB [Oceanipulchritudo sp.]|nr:alpha-ketoglutarate-dependent dioxygenase AlkB [Oceanipulchritudo sp.]